MNKDDSIKNEKNLDRVVRIKVCIETGRTFIVIVICKLWGVTFNGIRVVHPLENLRVVGLFCFSCV